MIKLYVILIALLGCLYRLTLTLVQYRSANNPTPENLSDVYDEETYATWKKYSAEHCRLSIFSTIASTIVTLLLLGTNCYAAFAALFPEGEFLQLLSVILIETAIGTVISVVEKYIGVMVIEQKYGFNRSTMKTFIFDCIRSLLLEIAISVVIAYLICLSFGFAGVWMIPIFAGSVFCITLLITFLYPIFSRIGNKFVPLEEGELKDNLMALLTKHGYKVKAIEVMDASRRTTKLNAYFTGFGKMKTIVLFDNLVNAMSPDEICAVFAHELGHGLYKDVPKRQILNLGNMLIMGTVAFLAASMTQLHTAFGFAEVNYGFAYILTGIGLSLVQPLVGIISNAYSRAAEYRADRQAVKEGYGPAMTTALKKLARENFAHLAPSKINVALEYSHPPLADRIAAVEKCVQEIAEED